MRTFSVGCEVKMRQFCFGVGPHFDFQNAAMTHIEAD
jgi:hypothetical protein